MGSNSKVTTLEAKLLLLSTEQGYIVNKDADVTVTLRAELSELFTVTSVEYEAMYPTWHKATEVLPNYAIVHKQNWSIKKNH